MRQVSRLDADARVGDEQRQHVALGPDSDRDAAVARRELERIRQQVDEDLLAGAPVGNKLLQARGIVAHQSDAGLFGLEAENVAAGIDQRAHVEGLGEDVEAAGLDLRHVEDRIDDRQKMLAGRMDDAGIFPALGFVLRHQRVVAEHLGEAEDRVERRAQFVADIGEEAVLPGARAIGIEPRLLARCLGLMLARDVAQNGQHATAAVGGHLDAAGAHFDPGEDGLLVGRAGCFGHAGAQAQDRHGGLRPLGSIGDRLQERGPILHENALEETAAGQFAGRQAEQLFAGAAHLDDRARAVLFDDEIAQRRGERVVARRIGKGSLFALAAVVDRAIAQRRRIEQSRRHEDRRDERRRILRAEAQIGECRATKQGDKGHGDRADEQRHRCCDGSFERRQHEPDDGRCREAAKAARDGGGGEAEAGDADGMRGHQPASARQHRHAGGRQERADEGAHFPEGGHAAQGEVGRDARDRSPR